MVLGDRSDIVGGSRKTWCGFASWNLQCWKSWGLFGGRIRADAAVLLRVDERVKIKNGAELNTKTTW